MVTEGPASVLQSAETRRYQVERLEELAPQASVSAATVRICLIMDLCMICYFSVIMRNEGC